MGATYSFDIIIKYLLLQVTNLVTNHVISKLEYDQLVEKSNPRRNWRILVIYETFHWKSCVVKFKPVGHNTNKK